MALITLPVTVPVPATIPQADYNIGRHAELTNWLTLNKEAHLGANISPRKGSVGGTATGALAFEEITNAKGKTYAYPRWDDTSGAPIISWIVDKPSDTFSIVSAQRFDTAGTDPWAVFFGGSGISGVPRIRPNIHGSGPAYSGVSLVTSTATNVIYGSTTPKPPLGIGFATYYVFKFADMNAPEVLISNDGVSFTSTGILTEFVGQTIAPQLGISIGEGGPADPMNGPVPDIMIFAGDISQNGELTGAINDYVINDIFGGA